ncbi:MAG: hypothetical protein II824_02390 [Bacteroidales bacterium]|nr:hypothetical protein [Bacteroidales bacterium]
MTQDELDAIKAAVNEAMNERDRQTQESFLKRRDTAKRLAVDLSTLWRWEKAGYLIPIRRGGRLWYAESDIIKLENGKYVA